MTTKVIYRGNVLEIDGALYHHHPNGGGLVAQSASVEQTVFLGPQVMVKDQAQILGNVNIDGVNVRIERNALLEGDVSVRDNVLVTGTSKVSGQVKLSDGVSVEGSSNIKGDVWISGTRIISSGLSRTGRLKGTGKTVIIKKFD